MKEVWFFKASVFHKIKFCRRDLGVGKEGKNV